MAVNEAITCACCKNKVPVNCVYADRMCGLCANRASILAIGIGLMANRREHVAVTATRAYYTENGLRWLPVGA